MVKSTRDLNIIVTLTLRLNIKKIVYHPFLKSSFSKIHIMLLSLAASAWKLNNIGEEVIILASISVFHNNGISFLTISKNIILFLNILFCTQIVSGAGWQ